MEYMYVDGRRVGGRFPCLYLAKEGQVAKFEGKNIEGYCEISGKLFKPDGEWSSTTYTLLLAPDVRPLCFLSPLHGTWGENFISWEEVASELKLPVEVAKKIVREEYPATADRLDTVEQFAASLNGAKVERVIITFGSPTRKQIQAGYWKKPKGTETKDGRKVVVKPGPNGWEEAEVVSPAGAKILSRKYNTAMYGGGWSIEVLVSHH